MRLWYCHTRWRTQKIQCHWKVPIETAFKNWLYVKYFLRNLKLESNFTPFFIAASACIGHIRSFCSIIPRAFMWFLFDKVLLSTEILSVNFPFPIHMEFCFRIRVRRLAGSELTSNVIFFHSHFTLKYFQVTSPNNLSFLHFSTKLQYLGKNIRCDTPDWLSKMQLPLPSP